mgnify:CR=1 FL=1
MTFNVTFLLLSTVGYLLTRNLGRLLAGSRAIGRQRGGPHAERAPRHRRAPVSLLMVVVIFGALPLVSLKGEHVVFDSLDVVLPRLVRKIQQGLVHLVCAALHFGLAY